MLKDIHEENFRSLASVTPHGGTYAT